PAFLARLREGTFSKQDSLDRPSLLSVLDLVVCRRRRRQVGPFEPLEIADGREQGIDARAVIGMIRGDPHAASVFQARSENLEKHAVEKPALSLTLLGPRVGKID